MPVTRRIADNRSFVTLAALVGFSVISLASGADGSLVTRPVRFVVSVVSSPVWIVLHTVQNAAGAARDFVFDYNKSLREADDLRLELNAATQRIVDLQEVQAENARLTQMLDFVRDNPTLELVPASVVDEYDGILTIDRGSVHGIEINMSVLSTEGVAGIVIETLPLVSRVASLHRAECKVGAVVRRNRVRGVVHGSGMEASHVCSLQYIDLKDEIRIGDEVVSGGGGVYPSGYPIGRVSNVIREEGSLLQTAYLEPYVDPYRLDEIFVVKRAQIPHDELAETAPEPAVAIASVDDKVKLAAPPAPDLRSIQEQLAP